MLVRRFSCGKGMRLLCGSAGILLLMQGATQAQAQAQAQQAAGQIYLGNYLGYGMVASGDLRQRGQAFDEEDMAFSVDAVGASRSGQVLSAGLNVGYEWPAFQIGQGRGQRLLRPALEAEIFYLTHSRKGRLDNQAPGTPSHAFDSRVSMNIGALLVNGVWTLNAATDSFQPYFGVGIGTAFITASGLDSAQLSQTERVINFFNPRLNASSNGLAMLGKAGFRGALSDNMEYFAEYRFVQIASTDYRFGPALFINQTDSAPWRIDVSPMRYHLGLLGIRFKF